MSEKKAEYLNFPIEMLSGFMVETKDVLMNILYYNFYNHSLKLEKGTELQKILCCEGHFGVTLGSAALCLKQGKELFNKIPENSPKTGLSIPMFFDYLKNEKSEFEKACLLCFLAIKSILGPNKPYCKVTNIYLWSRMDGKANAVAEVSELSNEVRKYANRYQTEKIKEDLIFNWSLIHYSQFTRGFYVSFKISLEDLIFEAEKRRLSIKQKQLKQILNEAKEKALERLKTPPP